LDPDPAPGSNFFLILGQNLLLNESASGISKTPRYRSGFKTLPGTRTGMLKEPLKCRYVAKAESQKEFAYIKYRTGLVSLNAKRRREGP
jgi:hypothetical protein